MKRRGSPEFESLVKQRAAPAAYRVLIASSTAETLERAQMLRRRGFELISAHDTDSALLELRRSRPDVICVDLDLPPLGGIELAMRIRNSPEGLGIVLIALADEELLEAKEQAMIAGYNLFMKRPIDTDSLVRLVGEGRTGSSR